MVGPRNRAPTSGGIDALHVDVNGIRLWFDVDGPVLVPDGSQPSFSSTAAEASEWSLQACADDIRHFCDALGIEAPIALGHSLGAPVVLQYGARHPGHAAGIVVQSGFARWDTPRLVEGFRRVAGDQVAAIAQRGYTGEPMSDEEPRVEQTRRPPGHRHRG